MHKQDAVVLIHRQSRWITESSGGIIVQVNNFGSVANQTNIDHSISFPQADIQAGIGKLKQLIATGSIPETVGTEIVAEVEESLDEADGRPTSRLKASLLRLRDMLAVGGASADDVAKVAGAVTAVSEIIGG
ncbi:hypothetical protein [Nonomuraea sp. NPDC023979]|uniref:hypothetical protein n=1 Tax=Nonomuraea sp. NPDC023979 TaxID=3154796 RepID=UPI0033F18D9F